MKRIKLVIILAIFSCAALLLPIYLYWENISGKILSLTTPYVVVEPSKINIPTLDITAQIEYVGLDKKGNMAVPKNIENVAWYALGYSPGEEGNAVLAGHYDGPKGMPAVFYEISKLTKGDIISISGEKGKELSFRVTSVKNYPYDEFPIILVFGKSDKRRLNLITCDGVFNPKTNTYSERTVVFSEAVD